MNFSLFCLDPSPPPYQYITNNNTTTNNNNNNNNNSIHNSIDNNISNKSNHLRQRHTYPKSDFSDEYDPWGKPGCGAPLKDQNDNTVADLKSYGVSDIISDV